jgi:predicted DNA-binding transcriptional regulator AlpA
METSAMTIAPLALSIPDAVAACGIGRTRLYRAIKDGEVPVAKIGKRTVILADDLRTWLRRNRKVQPQQRARTEAARTRNSE